MQEINHVESQKKNPYIQIMFNINSKNVVNNNILSQKQKHIQFQLPKQIKAQKIDKTFILGNKKNNQQPKSKTKKLNSTKSQISSNRQQIIGSQQTCQKIKKKSFKGQKNNQQGSQTQRSTKQIKPKKRLSVGLITPNCQQNDQFQLIKKEEKSKLKIKNNKQLRQKVIQLMIKDYQKGKISNKNFKQAISSLIQQQTMYNSNNNKKNVTKSQIKTQKSKINIGGSYRNSLATSLRNTPKHKPTKSKSQKFYYQHNNNSKINSSRNGNYGNQDHHRRYEQQENQPKIVQTIIDRKQFVNKIIIKGINTSLFLSNEFTDKDSPTKKDPVNVTVINTSDSVRQLRRDMEKTVMKCNQEINRTKQKEQLIQRNFNKKKFAQKQELKYSHIQNNKIRQSIERIDEQKLEKSVLKIQAAWKKYKTKKILSSVIQQLQNSEQNQLIYSRLNFQQNRQQKSVQSLTSFIQPSSSKNTHQQQLSRQNIEQKSQIYIQASNELLRENDFLNGYEIREDFQESENYSKIQELQKQYALILKDNFDSRYLSSREDNSCYRSQEESVGDYSVKVNIKDKINQDQNNRKSNQQHNNQTKNIQQNSQEQIKFKPYLSSQIGVNINSAIKKHFGIETIKQEYTQKKINLIKSNQIRKLNEILDIIKVELDKKQGGKGFLEETRHNNNLKVNIDKQNKGENVNGKKSNPLILQQIAAILENQRNSLEKQLKIYGGNGHKDANKLNESNKQKKQQKSQKESSNQQDEQEQQNVELINSFKKKIDKKRDLLKFRQPQEILYKKYQENYEESNDKKNLSQYEIKSISSLSNKSFRSSSTYSNHLQKNKISELNLDYIEIGLKKRLYDLSVKKEQEICLVTQRFINDKISAKQYQEQKEIIQKWFRLESNQLKKTKNKLLNNYKKAKEYLMQQTTNNDVIRYSNKLTKEKSLKMIKCISQKYLLDKNKQSQKIQQEDQRVHNQQNQRSKINDKQIKLIIPKQRKQQKQRLSKKSSNFNNSQQNIHTTDSSIKNNNPFQEYKDYKQTLQDLQNQLLLINPNIKKLSSIQEKSQNDELMSPQFLLPKNVKSSQVQPVEINSLQLKDKDKTSKQIVTQLINQTAEQQDQKQQDMLRSRTYGQYSRQINKTQLQSSQQQIQIKQQLKSQISNFLDRYQEQYLNQQYEQQDEYQDEEQEHNFQEDGQEFERYYDGYVEQQQEDEYSEQRSLKRESNNNKLGKQEKISSFSPQSYSNQQSYEKNINYLSDDQEEENQFQNMEDGMTETNIIVNKKKNDRQSNGNEDLKQKQKELLLFSPQKTKFKEQFSQQLKSYQQTHNIHTKISSFQIQNSSLLLLQQNNQTQLIKTQQLLIDPAFQKLKYLTQEDKDDIFEFMFLDLCLQVFLEQTKNNKIMKSIQRHILHLRKKRKIPKGFKTNLMTCKNYVQTLIQFIKSNYFVNLKRLEYPMGPSAKEMLKFMRDYSDDSEEDMSEIQTVNLILQIEIYEAYDSLPVNKLILQRYYDDDQKEESRLKFLNSLKHIHNKAIFDSLNQSLDYQRSYGIWGKPFPWKKSLSVNHVFTQAQLKIKLEKASQKVIENCSYLCGVMVDKQDSVFGKTNISEEYLLHIREDRMSKMLSNDMLDSEDRWIFYDDQQTEVLVEIAKFVAKSIFEQMARQVAAFQAFRRYC